MGSGNLRIVGLGALLLLIAVLLFVLMSDEGAGRQIARATESTKSVRPIVEVGMAASAAGSTEARIEAEVGKEPASAAPAQPAQRLPEGQGLELRLRRGRSSDPVLEAEVLYWNDPDADDDEEQSPWRWHEHGELEARIEETAQRMAIEEGGIVRVSDPEHRAVVVARGAGLWGWLTIDDDSTPPLELNLWPDGDLLVRVVDAQGKSVPNAPVVLRHRQWSWHNDMLRARTSPEDGLARLVHARPIIEGSRSDNESWSAAVGAVFEKGIEAEVDEDAWPSEPMVLAVPAWGECEVHVFDPNGEPFRSAVDVELAVVAEEEEEPPMFGWWGRQPSSGTTLERVEGGVARFELVEPGRELVGRVKRSGSSVQHESRGPGPGAGGRARIDVRMGVVVAILDGRVVDADGAPRPELKLRIVIEREAGPGNSNHPGEQTKTDDAGRFEVDVFPQEASSAGSARVIVSGLGEDGQALESATIPLGNLDPGVHDLGDLLLAPAPRIAAGTVVDAASQPVERAWVTPSIKRFWGEEAEQFWWDGMWNDRVRTDTAGHFEIRGHVREGEVSLSAEAGGGKSAGQVVSVGASDVVLRLVSTGEIAGRVLADSPGLLERLHVQAERQGAENSADNRWFTAQVDEEGAFRMQEVVPGTYLVRVMTEGGWSQIGEFDDVRVVAGETTRDPRLDPLDLRGKAVIVELEIVDEAGEPLAMGHVFSASKDEDGSTSWSGSMFQNGKLALVHDGAGVTVAVMCPGYCTESRRDLVQDETIVMRRSPTVVFLLSTDVALPEPPLRLGVNLQLQQDDDIPNFFWGGDQNWFDESGRLEMRAPNFGRMTVYLQVARVEENGWSSTQVGFDEPLVIEVLDRSGEQVFELAPDPAKVAEAIEGMASGG
jgi:hypothetical protein